MVSTETFKLFWVVSLSSELFPWFYDSCFSLRKLSRILFRSSHRKCSIKEGVVKNFAKFKRNTCARVSFLIKLQAWGLRPATLLKVRLWHKCFPVNFDKFLRRSFLRENLQWLLLNVAKYLLSNGYFRFTSNISQWTIGVLVL